MNVRLVFVTMLAAATAGIGATASAAAGSEPIDSPSPGASEPVGANTLGPADVDAIVACRVLESVPTSYAEFGDFPGFDDPVFWRTHAIGGLGRAAGLGDARYAAIGDAGAVFGDAMTGELDDFNDALATLTDECPAILAEHGDETDAIAAALEPAAYDAHATCLLLGQVPVLNDASEFPGVDDPLFERLHAIGMLGTAASLGDDEFAALGTAADELVQAWQYFDLERFDEARSTLHDECVE